MFRHIARALPHLPAAAGSSLPCRAPFLPSLVSMNFTTSTADKKVYVGNLPMSMTEDEVKSFFESCGTVKTVKMVKDKTSHQFKGYGFVEFESTESAGQALQLGGKRVGGRPVTINPYKSKKPDVAAAKEASSSSSKIHFGNVPKEMVEHDVEALFAACGAIRAVTLVKDPAGVSRGYGSVEFEEIAAADAALKLVGRDVNGFSLIVRAVHENPAAGHLTVMVRQLAPTVTGDELAAQFAQYGGVERAYIIMNPETKQSKGYGFVEFKDPAAVQKAVDEADASGRKNVLLARKEESRVHTIYVGNMPLDIDEDKIRAVFESCGTIFQIRIANAPGSSRAFAHVQFETVKGATKGLRIRGTPAATIDGRKLFIEPAREE
ncbi:Aste57867_5600 [Aphanomyces stellatus]|uniref:Aste57867_5600 protein n=1 Tax=Aphanomyces stellatus TaxID=120398 RepID=A0A485KHG3_9STRA|nr:hypothetical protein As57867_005587 [Aphanomyces stellatus]VFT82646.1 Aste57867_5600 [Aphanomyces stellatus]